MDTKSKKSNPKGFKNFITIFALILALLFNGFSLFFGKAGFVFEQHSEDLSQAQYVDTIAYEEMIVDIMYGMQYYLEELYETVIWDFQEFVDSHYDYSDNRFSDEYGEYDYPVYFDNRIKEDYYDIFLDQYDSYFMDYEYYDLAVIDDYVPYTVYYFLEYSFENFDPVYFTNTSKMEFYNLIGDSPLEDGPNVEGHYFIYKYDTINASGDGVDTVRSGFSKYAWPEYENMDATFQIFIPYHSLIAMQSEWQSIRAAGTGGLIVFSLFLAGAFAIFLYQLRKKYTAGTIGGTIAKKPPKIGTDIRLGAVIAAAAILLSSFYALPYSYAYSYTGLNYTIFFFIVLTLVFFALWTFILRISANLYLHTKQKTFLRSMWLYRIWMRIRRRMGISHDEGNELSSVIAKRLDRYRQTARQFLNGSRFSSNQMRYAVIIRTVVTAVLSAALVIILIYTSHHSYLSLGYIMFLLLLIFLIYLAWRWYVRFILQIIDEMKHICKQIKVISDGELQTKTTLKPDSPLYESGIQLEHIGDGLQKSLEAQIKGERMKIDLITNVSHDLKTPLTSIIIAIIKIAVSSLMHGTTT